MKRIPVIILLLAFVCSSTLLGQQTIQPKREFRGAWLHTVGNKQFRTMKEIEIKDMFIRILDSLDYAGCNAVIFQVRPQADALYKSDIEPWSVFLTGEQGKAPKPVWDPLQFMIEECHYRGMELHAWCNPYRVTSSKEDSLSPTHIYYKYPQYFVKYADKIYFNPGEPFCIEYTKKVIADIVSRYDIDAIHFDDYFYPYPVRGETFNDSRQFNKYGKLQGFSANQKADWRRNNITTLIREVNDTIKKIKPWVRFGISPFGIYRNKHNTPDKSGSNTNGLSCYDDLYADSELWAKSHYIDYLAPQLYWTIGHKLADYNTLIKWWNRRYCTEHLYIGQKISILDSQLEDKMHLSRTLENISGNIWWPGWSIGSNEHNIHDSLSYFYQSQKSLIPPYSQLDSTAPLPVKSIVKKGHNIHWECFESNDPMQIPFMYVVYLFPPEVTPDISNSKYIVKIVNTTSVKLDKKRLPKKGSKILVTVIDKCWNESPPSEAVIL